MSQLKEFHLFPELPFDIKALIWEAAIEPQLVEVFQEEDRETAHDDDLPLSEVIERDYCQYSPMIDSGELVLICVQNLVEEVIELEREKRGALYDVIAEPGHTSYGMKQAQLERFGFTTCRPAPALRRVRLPLYHEWTRLLEFSQRAPPLSPLFLVSRESLELLKHNGWDLAFGGRDPSTKTWFNYRHDYAYLQLDIHSSQSKDVGFYLHFGLLASNDLALLRKLVLACSAFVNSQPSMMAIQSYLSHFKNLEELILVDRDLRDWHGKHLDFIYDELDSIDFKFLDCDILDSFSCRRRCHLTSRLGWEFGKHGFGTPGLRNQNFNSAGELYKAKADALVEMFTQARNKDVASGHKSWSIPKIRFAHIVNTNSEAAMIEHRENRRFDLSMDLSINI